MQTLHLPWICVLILILQTAVVSQTITGHGVTPIYEPLRLGFAILQNIVEVCVSIRCESWQWKYKTCEAPAHFKKDISRMNIISTMSTLHLPWICLLLLILQTTVVSQTVKEVCVPIRCESWRWKYKTCEAPAHFKKDISRMNLEVRHSRSSCHFRESFGYVGRTVWVDHGCRATFKICYYS